MRFIILLIFVALTWAQEEEVSVTSPNWEILGKRMKILDHEVDQFLGIPYAEPPVGVLRFKKPLPLKEFPKKIEAFKQPPSCHQVPLKIRKYIKKPFYDVIEEKKEDCLYLNIWRPVDKEESMTSKAVMIWVYGGAFLLGSVSMPFYNGSALAGLGDVVLVTLNYRLGSFGLLTAGTDEEPGNIALYDQQMAFRWVRDNIHHFGGDPSRITIFGESAGGISIAAQITSPLNRGLFQRAIVQSGTTLVPNLVSSKDTMITNSDRLAKQAGCLEQGQSLRSHPNQVLNCMRSKSPEQLIEAEYEFMEEREEYEQLSIIFDDNFLGYKSKFPFNPNNINHVELMIGVTKDEMGSLYNLFFSDIYKKDFSKLSKEDVYTISKRFLKDVHKDKLVDKIMQYYFQNVDEHNSTALDMTMTRLLTDFTFTCPTVYFLDHEGFKKQDVHFYYYTHHNSFNFPLRKATWPGAFHFEEVLYVFGVPLMIQQLPYTEMEKTFSKDLISLWTSFAKSGHPESPHHYHWPRYTPEHPLVLDLHAAGAKVYPLPQIKVCRKTWREIFAPDEEGHCHSEGSGDMCT